ncbi:MAG: FAD-dependent monooxygenase [Legionellaceae bacterium]|nr:FAD-dependent monooxygenase [Legionellaceae bacterium]
MIEQQTDILIIGGGLTGASLLLALRDSPCSALMIDAKALATDDEQALEARSLALAPASLRILQQLGIGEAVKAAACPISSIHVSQQGAFGRSVLRAKAEPLGYVIAMHQLNRLLLAALPTATIDAPAQVVRLNTEAHWLEVRNAAGLRRVHYQILVAADGARSMVRQQLAIPASSHDYQQEGIVANVALQRDHRQQAYERFTAQGPLALLPLGEKRMALVWAMAPAAAKAALQLSDSAFLQHLQRSFGYRLGRFSALGPRSSYPLFQVLARDCVQGNSVLIGSAAQHLHPVAGQGFNLALRDVATLAQSLCKHGLQPRALRHYAQLRQHDRQVICRFTDGLVRMFSAPLPGLATLRGLGLLVFDQWPPLQEQLAQYARGFGGTPPDLACGLSLKEGARGQ